MSTLHTFQNGSMAVASKPKCCSRLAPIIGAGAIAVATMIATAPAAQAERDEQEIKADCELGGGTYNTYVDALGNRWSTCCVPLASGKMDCGIFENGNQQGINSIGNEPGTPTPTRRGPPPGVVTPINPPGNNIGPG